MATNVQEAVNVIDVHDHETFEIWRGKKLSFGENL
jgi:hypothetical protein